MTACKQEPLGQESVPAVAVVPAPSAPTSTETTELLDKVKEAESLVAAATAEKTGPGYTTDPYAGETTENFVAAKIVAWIVLRLTGIVVDADGFCSDAREWHIMWKGIWAGARAPQLADIPECPPLWQDESQYYEGGALFANVLKIYGFGGVAGVIGSLVALQAAGVPVLSIDSLRAVLAVFGVTI